MSSFFKNRLLVTKQLCVQKCQSSLTSAHLVLKFPVLPFDDNKQALKQPSRFE